MKARVKRNYRWPSVQFDGMEYLKTEWRKIPEGREDVARQSGLLELQEPVELEPDQKQAEPKSAPKPRSRRRTKAAQGEVQGGDK